MVALNAPALCVTPSSIQYLMYSPNGHIPGFPIAAPPGDLRPNVERRGTLPLIYWTGEQMHICLGVSTRNNDISPPAAADRDFPPRPKGRTSLVSDWCHLEDGGVACRLGLSQVVFFSLRCSFSSSEPVATKRVQSETSSQIKSRNLKRLWCSLRVYF